MTILNKQTTFRLQTFYTIILLVLFSSFDIGKCYGVQMPEEDDRPLVTTEDKVKNGYSVMKLAPSPDTSEKAPGECNSPPSNSQNMDSLQSNTDHEQYYPHDDTPEGYVHVVDGNNENVQELGYHHNDNYYNDGNPNNFPNGQNDNPSIVPDNAQISALVQAAPQYKLFASISNLLQDNNISSSNGPIPNDLQKAQTYDAIPADLLALYTNVANKGPQYQLINHNDERMAAFYILRNIYTKTHTVTHIDTPEGMTEEECNVNDMAMAHASLMMADYDISTYHSRAADQAPDHNATPIINTVAGAHNIIWISIIYSILYLMRYFFEITQKSYANWGNRIFFYYRFAYPSKQYQR